MIPDAFYVSNLITRGRMQCKTTAYKMLKSHISRAIVCFERLSQS